MVQKSIKLSADDLLLKPEALAKKLHRDGHFADLDSALHYAVSEKLARAEELRARAAEDKKLAAKLAKQARHAQKAVDAAKARADDTARKVVAGAIVLKAVESEPKAKEWLRKLLDSNVRKNERRALFQEQFGLEPLPDDEPEAASVLPAAEIVQETLEDSGPVKYPVFIFQVGESYGGWSPDFVSLKIEGRSKQDALGNAIMAVQEAVSKAPGTAPRPSTEKDARQTFKSSAAQRFGSVPEFSLEWVAVE